MLNKRKIGMNRMRKLAILLSIVGIFTMPFCNRNETATNKRNREDINSDVTQQDKVNKSGITQKPRDLTNQIVEIKTDGNYIDNKLCSGEEIEIKGQQWSKSRGKWTLLLVDDSLPNRRIDEVREILYNAGVHFITQSIVGTNEIIYPAGDVSEFAKFSQGDFEVWLSNRLNSPETRSIVGHQRISFVFIVDKNGKVKDAHIIKGTDSPEYNAALEKILIQMPDWEPAIRNDEKASVYYWMH